MAGQKIANYFGALSLWVVVTYFLSSFHDFMVAQDGEPLSDWFIALMLSWPLWILMADASETIDKRIPAVGGYLERGLKIAANLTVILTAILVGRFFWWSIMRWFTAFHALLMNDNLVQTVVGMVWLITGISILIPDVKTDSGKLASSSIWSRLAYSAVFLLGILRGVLVSSLGIGMLIAGLSGG